MFTAINSKKSIGKEIERNSNMANLLQVADWSPLNPDIVVLQGSDPAAAAVVVNVASLPAVGETMTLQLNFNGDQGGVDFPYVVQAGDTTSTVGAALCNAIISNPTCSAANISGQTAGNSFGVTNHMDNLVTVTAISHPECFLGLPATGAPQLDAGPVLALNRGPANITVPPGSNIGQVTFGSNKAGETGQATVEYGVISCNLLNNDPNNLDGEIAFYTMESDSTGIMKLVKRMSISKAGVSFPGGVVLPPNVAPAPTIVPVQVPVSSAPSSQSFWQKFLGLFGL
jgi:hypothetical protein